MIVTQCALPVLDGLLPSPHNETILDLVFVMGCWHAYAKLRIHTESTLTSFEHITKDLGTLIRYFATTTCEAFSTTELPREQSARLRRNAANGTVQAGGGGTKAKTFNLRTYKLHALGDYPKTIRERGTTDNYTSARVCDTLLKCPELTFRLTQRSRLSIDAPRRSIRQALTNMPLNVILAGWIGGMRC